MLVTRSHTWHFHGNFSLDQLMLYCVAFCCPGEMSSLLAGMESAASERGQLSQAVLTPDKCLIPLFSLLQGILEHCCKQDSVRDAAAVAKNFFFFFSGFV